jgi:hypothetical protein
MWPQAAATTRGFAAVEDGGVGVGVGDGGVAGAEGVGAPPAAIVEGAPLAAIVEGGEGGIRTSQAPLEMRLSLIVDLRNHPESLIFNKKR